MSRYYHIGAANPMDFFGGAAYGGADAVPNDTTLADIANALSAGGTAIRDAFGNILPNTPATAAAVATQVKAENTSPIVLGAAIIGGLGLAALLMRR